MLGLSQCCCGMYWSIPRVNSIALECRDVDLFPECLQDKNSAISHGTEHHGKVFFWSQQFGLTEQTGHCEMTNSPKDESNIFRSPFFEPDAKIPEVSLTDLLFESLDMNYEELKDDTWVADVIKETSYKFGDIKPMTKKFASALTRMGFKKEEYERQMREVSTRFILCDPETAPSVKWAAEQLDWPVHLLSIGGEVEGATAVEEMIKNDDCSAFPHSVEINPKEDVVSIPNTSGSSGVPKGAMHTHFNLVALTTSAGAPVKFGSQRKWGKSYLSLMGNFSVGALCKICLSLSYGYSYYSVSKLDQKTFLKHILKYKPERLIIYPYVATWLARAPELDLYDLSFIKAILCGGSVNDSSTSELLSTRLPHIKLMQMYGMTECLAISSTHLYHRYEIKNYGDNIAGLKIKSLDNEVHVSCGLLLPLFEAKIVDSKSGCSVGSDMKGNIWVRAPYIMKGYASSSVSKGYISDINEDGWLDTGDLGFFDNYGHLYVIERRSSIFKYYMHQVSPAELEAVIGEHPAVLSVGVVGVPHPVTTSTTRAYVMLKPGHQATEEEIKQYVAERKIFYKHLHGGIAFVDSLPASRGGKLDRPALLRKAIAESQLFV